MIELVIRIFAAFVLVAVMGFTGACLANCMAWVGACIFLCITYYITMHKLFRRPAYEIPKPVNQENRE